MDIVRPPIVCVHASQKCNEISVHFTDCTKTIGNLVLHGFQRDLLFWHPEMGKNSQETYVLPWGLKDFTFFWHPEVPSPHFWEACRQWGGLTIAIVGQNDTK